MIYFDELKRAMEWLGQQENTCFIGQAVSFPGTAMYNTLKDIDPGKRIELPVFEDIQVGLSIGLSLEGYVPISVFPRLNFLLCAMNQIVNHLDKYPFLGYPVKVIVRTSIGSQRPLHPQYQHVGDFTNAINLMLKTAKVVRLDEPDEIFTAYKEAYEREGSTILIEWGDFYNEK